MKQVKRRTKKRCKSIEYTSGYRRDSYSRGRNWSSSHGHYYNGYDQRARNPYSFFQQLETTDTDTTNELERKEVGIDRS